MSKMVFLKSFLPSIGDQKESQKNDHRAPYVKKTHERYT